MTGAVLFGEDVTNASIESVQGNDLTLSVEDGAVFVNSAKVVIPNIILTNGVAHVIDSEVFCPFQSFAGLTSVASSTQNPAKSIGTLSPRRRVQPSPSRERVLRL